jgi:hypothetical protein
MDGALLSVGEEKLRGVSIHIKLIVGGNDFEAVINDILVENGGPSLFIGIAEPAESQVVTWHWATRCWGMYFLAIFIF